VTVTGTAGRPRRQCSHGDTGFLLPPGRSRPGRRPPTGAGVADRVQRFILQGMYDNARATGVWTSVSAVPSTVATGPGVGLQEIADAVGVGVGKVREIPRHDSGYDPSVDRV